MRLARLPRAVPRRPTSIALPFRPLQSRSITASEKPLPVKPPSPNDATHPKGPNEEQLPHVSEEAAMTAKIQGETPPDIQQGTPIGEVLNRSKDDKDSAPQVVKDDLAKAKMQSTPSSGKRSFSTYARRRSPLAEVRSETLEVTPPHAMNLVPEEQSKLIPGLKFEMPVAPPRVPKFGNYSYDPVNMKARYDPLIQQLVNTIMLDGKKASALGHVSKILTVLRTAPAPRYDPAIPLLPGAPPATHLPLNPTLYLQLALDSIAPLVALKSRQGMVGGGASLQIPHPLNVIQRRRRSIKWIQDLCQKRVHRGSGKWMFATKFAEELIAIVEGKSMLWERRRLVHEYATLARANLVKLMNIRPGRGKSKGRKKMGRKR